MTAYDMDPNERENGMHDIDVYGSSSGSGEILVISDDMWHTLEIMDESSLDGEHIPKTSENFSSYDEEVSDHQRLLDDMSCVARFLKSRGMIEDALEVATDPDYRFDLAMQLGRLEVAKDIATEVQSESKWKQLGELAMSTGKRTRVTCETIVEAGYY
ncbi:Coatomer subunit [Arachis hypogaea]|nr:Coatomer subunit [Arachis hypogaea]